LLVSLLSVCLIFLLYRRAGRLVTIAQPLKNLLRSREGRIRLEEEAQEAQATEGWGRDADEEQHEEEEREERTEVQSQSRP